MTKGEKNKDISNISTWGEIVYKDNKGEFDIGERNDKGRGSIKILSTQVGGASS